MKSKFVVCFVMLVCVFSSFKSFAQSEIDEKKAALVGRWQFVYYTSLSEPSKPSDACAILMEYKFNEDGTVNVINVDSTAGCKYASETKKWSIITMHDNRGKEHFAVRMFEDGVGPRASYDGNTFTDEIYMFVSFKKKFFTWIPKPQYSVPSTNDMQAYYRRKKS
jgi:hypothetical protein